MADYSSTEAVRYLQAEAYEFNPQGSVPPAILDLVGNARVVLLGEASHGTHEFYDLRAEITKRLIVEKGFTAVVLEADWPDTSRVHRYVRGWGDDADAERALGGFKRFPTWMWRNEVMVKFVEWMRGHNRQVSRGYPRAGIYGMDLYSLHTSMQAVLRYLDKVDRIAAARARARYACFDHFGEDPQAYGYATSTGIAESCEAEAIGQLLELRSHAADFLSRDGDVAADEYFFAEQNARLVKNAESYYRAMFRGRPSTWNLRDQHMMETLEALRTHLGQREPDLKLVVWAHNSHLGDARATEMSQRGELNVGQLVRERYGDAAVSIGFSTYTGTVTAASDWDAPAETKRVRPGLTGSYEALFHAVDEPAFFLNLRQGTHARAALMQRRLERAIGVIYRPDTERLSHYFFATLPEQFDGIIHLDETRAVEPLEVAAAPVSDELPETFPFVSDAG